MKLTDRDQKLLNDIQNYGLLPTKLICDRHFPDVASSTVLRRLRLLEEAQYIQRISGLDYGGNAWCMTKRGAEMLNGQPAKTSYPRQIISHDLTLMHLRIRLEEVGIAQAWIPEHVIRKRMAESTSFKNLTSANIPDGLMGVETGRGTKQAYAIELELTAKNQDRYQAILDQYEEREDLYAYWYIVQKETIGRQIMKAARGGYHRYGLSEPYLVWSLLEEVLRDPLTAKIYGQREKLVVSDMFILKTEAAQRPA